MKSFIVKIPVTQEDLGPLLAKISGDGPQQYEIQTVEDVPHYKNGKAHQKAAKAPKPKHGAVTAAVIEYLPNMPVMFKAFELSDALAEKGITPKNIYGIIGGLMKRGLIEKMAEGRYKKVSA